jgi:hypothetical protein
MRQTVTAGPAREAVLDKGGRASASHSGGSFDSSIVGLQQSAGNRAVLSLLSGPRIQAKANRGCADRDPYEAEADRAADAIVSGGLAPSLSGAPSGDDDIQRKCASCEEEEKEQTASSPDPDPGGGGSATAASAGPAAAEAHTASAEASLEQEAAQEPGAAPAPGLIVEESAPEAPPGAMRKPEFLSALRQSVCTAVDSGTAGTGESSAGCPWIAHWFDYYEGKSARHLERALLKYAPEARGATSASDYIRAATARVEQGVAVWRETGEITGLPEGMSPEVPGAEEAGGVFSAIGGLFFKARGGGPKSADPTAVRSRLGGGSSLDGSIRSRMESAFGVGFSGVRVHTDSTAGKLSNDMNARAFTLGRDVAFGSGEYRPGTPVGDALIAHELAHVVQQGAGESAAPQSKGVNPATSSLELDADNAAVAATASLWGRAITGGKGLTAAAMPRLRSGLQLQRCKSKPDCHPVKCEEAAKTVTVDLIKLHGSTRTPATDLGVAKTAYAPCCLDVVAGKQETVSETDTKAWLGGDTVIDQDTSSCTPTAEETEVLSKSTTKYSLSGRLHAFYVEDSTYDARARSCLVGGQYGKSLWVYNTAEPRSLAHEIGHVLIDTSDHAGICDPAAKDNVMTPTNDATGQVLDSEQCKRAKNNA